MIIKVYNHGFTLLRKIFKMASSAGHDNAKKTNSELERDLYPEPVDLPDVLDPYAEIACSALQYVANDPAVHVEVQLAAALLRYRLAEQDAAIDGSEPQLPAEKAVQAVLNVDSCMPELLAYGLPLKMAAEGCSVRDTPLAVFLHDAAQKSPSRLPLLLTTSTAGGGHEGFG